LKSKCYKKVKPEASAKKKRRFFLRFLIFGTFLPGLLCAGLFLWIQTNLPSVSFLKSHMEKALQERAAGCRMDIGDIRVSASVRDLIPGLKISRLRIYRAEKEILFCPEIFVAFDLSQLIRGRIQPAVIRAPSPRMMLPLSPPAAGTVGEQRETSRGPAGHAELAAGAKEIISQIQTFSEDFPFFQKLDIRNAFLEKAGMRTEISALRLRHEGKKNYLNLSLEMPSGKSRDRQFCMKILLKVFPDKSEMETEFLDLSLPMLSAFFPSLSFLKDCRFPLDGKFSARIGDSGIIEIENAQLRSRGGSFFHSRIWKKKLQMETLEIRGNVSENLSCLRLDSFLLALDEPVFKGSGEICFREKGPEIRLEIRGDGIRPERSHLYWPYALVPPVREWIRDHFQAGIISNARLRLRLRPEDCGTGILPEDAIAATVPFQDVRLDYYPPLEAVRGVSGVGRFSAHGVEIPVSRGAVYDTKLHQGRVFIDWIKKRAEISIRAAAQGPAEDLRKAAYALTGRTKPGFSVKEGNADTKLSFDFPLNDFEHEDFRYRITSEIRNIRIPDFYGYALSLDQLSAGLENQELTFEGQQGKAENPRSPSGAIPVAIIRGKGKVLYDPPGLKLDNFFADLDGPQIRASAFVTYKEEYPHIDANIRVDALPLSRALACWPPELIPSVREQIRTRFSAGYIDNAFVRLNMEPHVFRQKHLPKVAVEAHVPFKDLVLDYYPPLPRLTAGSGIATFYADSLHAEVSGGRLGNSQIENATVRITGFDRETADMEIHAALTGPLQDILQARKIPGAQYKWADLPDIQKEVMAGTRLHLAFPLRGDLSEEMLDISGSADIRNIQIPDIAGISLSGGEISARFGKEELRAAGNIRVGNTPVRVDINSSFPASGSPENSIRLQAVLDSESLSDFGLSPLPFLKGKAPCSALVSLHPDHAAIVWKGDFTDTEIEIREMGLHKARGQTADMTIRAAFPESREMRHIRIKDFLFKSRDIRFSGKGDFRENRQGSETELHFEKVNFADNDFSLQFQNTNTGKQNRIRAQLRGKKLNAVPLLRFLHEKNGGKEEKKTEARKKKSSVFSGNISADLENLQLENRVSLRSLTMSSEWNSFRILSAEMAGTHAENENISLRLSPAEKGKKLLIRSDNAGALLKGLDISPNIIGGELELEGSGDFAAEKPLDAQIRIRNYALINAPLLMQILSTASFVGILEQLQSGGVAFDSLDAALEYRPPELILKEGKMEGMSMGMSAAGKISFADESIDVRGLVVPFNLLNKVVGIIPFLGKMIVGDGIIAANYSILGTYKNPETAIAPLSTLALGSLRNLFRHIELQKAPDVSDRDEELLNMQEHKK
jgi:hypothetical protein